MSAIYNFFVSITMLGLCIIASHALVVAVAYNHHALFITQEGCAVYCDYYVSVCMSVCLHVSKTKTLNVTKSSVHVACGCSAVILWRRCKMLSICLSGFVNVVMFSSCLHLAEEVIVVRPNRLKQLARLLYKPHIIS